MKKYFLSSLVMFTIWFAQFSYAELNGHAHAGHGIKCGTPELIQNMLLGTAKITQREARNTSVVSTQGHFRVHYDTTGFNAPDLTDLDSNRIPDYVDSALIYLEYAWDLMVNTLGYPEPLSDGGKGGGDEIDAYLLNLGRMYGQTVPDNNFTTSTSSYMEIDNDFSEGWYESNGYEALKVTTAHEFFHTIHFRLLKNWDLIWWMEQSAVWMEDRAWDDVNDYLAYLYLFFDNFQPLDYTLNSFMYGSTLWAHYLADRFGDDIIRDIWLRMSAFKSTDIARFNDIIPIGLPSAFAEFAVWNYFTSHRANTIDFYPDSNLFNDYIHSDVYITKPVATDTLFTYTLTSRYVEIELDGVTGADHDLRVQVLPFDGGNYINTVIFYNGPYDYSIRILNPEGGTIPLEQNWQKVVLVTSCTNTRSDTYTYMFETEIIENGTSVEETAPVEFTLHGAYPNPFNPSTTLSFTMPEPGTVAVEAYNALGQKADDIFQGSLDAGRHDVVWRPSNLSGGVYLIRVRTLRGVQTAKTLYLK